MIAGVEIPPGDDPVDLGPDLAIAEVQLGQGQVAPGPGEPGPGLLDGRGVRHQLGEDPVDVPPGVELADLGQEIPPREQQTPEFLAAFHKAEIETWWPIIKAAGIKGQ